jgi:Protein of unknown function (DUF3040)
MTLHDPFAGESHEAPRRSPLRGFFTRRPRPARRSRPAGSAAAGTPSPSARARNRDRRRLAAIDRRLVAETPQLASMFTMFNTLNAEEGATGTEQLPPLPRRRPKPAYLAVLLALAAVAALCFALTSQVQAVVRPCLTSSAVAASPLSPTVGTASCAAYATNSGTKK